MDKNQLYKFLSDYVFKSTGILYKEADYYRLDSRINSLLKIYDLPNEEELFQFLAMEISPKMHETIVDLFTNNETYFLRDLKPFKAFATGIVSELEESGVLESTLNVWSCACSTGQEVYSIIMALDTFYKGKLSPTLRATGTDISEDALDKAKSGIYTNLEVQRGLPAPLLIKYFTKNEETECWSINESIKKKANFSKFNLLNGHYPVAKYDIIFCRNVLIYQDKENKQAILENLYNALKKGGYLFLGAGESLIGHDLNFKHVKVNDAWFYKKE